MKENRSEIVINASPEKVWQVMTDLTTNGLTAMIEMGRALKHRVENQSL